MARAAIGFFVLAIIAFVLGATGIAGISMEIAKFILVVFLVLAGISMIVALVTGNKTGGIL